MALQAEQDNNGVNFARYSAAIMGITARWLPVHGAHNNVVNRDRLPARRDNTHIIERDSRARLFAVTFIKGHFFNFAARQCMVSAQKRDP